LVLAGAFADDEKAKIVIRNAIMEALACAPFVLNDFNLTNIEN